MGKFKIDEESLLEEALSNIRDDRDETLELLAELRSEMMTKNVAHKEVGITASKYVETLQRSNEQLVKLITLLRKEKAVEGPLDLSEAEANEIFDRIKGT
jgi:hypothetical protein